MTSLSPEAWAWSGVGLVNLVAFATMGIDKRRATHQKRRISERTLLLQAAATGAVGSWLGVFVFRHKTRKAGFLIPLIPATAVNGLWLWMAGII